MPILVPSVLLSPSVSHYCTVLYAFEPPAHFGRIGRLCLLQTMYMFRPLPLHLWYLQPHLTFVPRAVLYCRRYSSTVQYILCTIEAAVPSTLLRYCVAAAEHDRRPPPTTAATGIRTVQYHRSTATASLVLNFADFRTPNNTSSLHQTPLAAGSALLATGCWLP